MTTSRLVLFKVAPPTQIYTLSLHDALPISIHRMRGVWMEARRSKNPGSCERMRSAHRRLFSRTSLRSAMGSLRSEEHTSELQSQSNLVCRLLLEKNNNVYIFSLHSRQSIEC